MRVSADGAGGRLRVGGLAFSFQRTRPDPRPTPSRGALPLLRASRFPRSRAVGWARGAFLVPIPAGEALWIGLGTSTAGPTAIRARLDELDGITGLPWEPALTLDPQNYVVWPRQLWIEGAYRDGRLHQRFALAAAPWRTLTLSVIPPRSRRARAVPAGPLARPIAQHEAGGSGPAVTEPGVLVPDRTGLRWAAAPEATVRIYLASPPVYTNVTGLPSPADVPEQNTYRGWRLP